MSPVGAKQPNLHFTSSHYLTQVPVRPTFHCKISRAEELWRTGGGQREQTSTAQDNEQNYLSAMIIHLIKIVIYFRLDVMCNYLFARYFINNAIGSSNGQRW